MSDETRSAATLCGCGHPKEAHRMLGIEHGWSKPCSTTIYKTVPDGMNAWPCPCLNFKEAEASG